jgi:hypothetical protein
MAGLQWRRLPFVERRWQATLLPRRGQADVGANPKPRKIRIRSAIPAADPRERIRHFWAGGIRRALSRSQAAQRRPVKPPGSHPQLDRNPEAIVDLFAASNWLTKTANKFLMGGSTEGGLTQKRPNLATGEKLPIMPRHASTWWLVGVLAEFFMSPTSSVADSFCHAPL